MSLSKVFLILSLLFSAQLWATESVEKPQVKPVGKYVVDDSLKTRMDTVLQIMKTFSKDDSKGAGGKIKSTVRDIFKSCKLAPEADAAIHPILAELLGAAGQLEKGQDKEGLKMIRKALVNYGDRFDHPGWKDSLGACEICR